MPDTIRRGGVGVESREAAGFDGGIAALADYGGVLIDNVPAKSFSPAFLPFPKTFRSFFWSRTEPLSDQPCFSDRKTRF